MTLEFLEGGVHVNFLVVKFPKPKEMSFEGIPFFWQRERNRDSRQERAKFECGGRGKLRTWGENHLGKLCFVSDKFGNKQYSSDQ